MCSNVACAASQTNGWTDRHDEDWQANLYTPELTDRLKKDKWTYILWDRQQGIDK